MSIISNVGRKSLNVKILFVFMYLFVISGSISMIYPFLIMMSGSIKDSVDSNYLNIVPRYLYDDVWVYRKHINGLFNERLLDMNIAYDTNVMSFEKLEPPEKINDKFLAEWEKFKNVSNLPDYSYTLGYVQANLTGSVPDGLRNFKGWLAKNIGKNIDIINSKLNTKFNNWNSIFISPPRCLLRRESPLYSKFAIETRTFAATLPEGLVYYASPQGGFVRLFLKAQYSDDINKYNRIHKTSYKTYNEIVLTRNISLNTTELQKKDWESFVRNNLALQWIEICADATHDFRNYLKSKYGSIDSLNKLYDTNYDSFGQILLKHKAPKEGVELSDWAAFVQGWKNINNDSFYQVKAEHMRIYSSRFMFIGFLQNKYHDLTKLNSILNTNLKQWEDIRIPQKQIHYSYFNRHKGYIRWRFIICNYLTVLEYLLFHGRGLFNTFVYCGLTVLSALIINPLTAYAMSRFKLPSSYMILLFLMCTMAFPPMVTAIPNFLLLRNFSMLNTFWALVLPTIANGYLIFLLKGFFDSLPRELYESASIDGASEWVLFWNITMSLSKPILAVVALQAFNAAYSNFMFAFVVCQDEKMWTLMVWLYQLQQRCGQTVMYASLLVAAIPTFIIFLFCQNIIMRGIVIPVEK